MRIRPSFASFALLAAAAVACGPAPSSVSPAASAAPSSSAPPPATAPAKLDAVPRLAFNRIAAELNVPLFWVDDTDASGSVDPAEVAVVWGLAPSTTQWVDGGKFTPAFQAAYEAIRKVYAEGYPTKGLSDAEKRRREAVVAELDQGLPSLIRSDFHNASAEDKAVVEHVVRAAEIIEQIYAKQEGSAGQEKDVPADDPASRTLFYRNHGPACEAPLTEKNPECNALPGHPAKQSGLYPASLQKDPKFCEKLEARKDHNALLDPFSVVVEAGGDLKAVPYTVAFKSEMEAVSRELKAAAAAVTSAGEAPMKAYLAAAAQSFLDNNWWPADEAWAKMTATNSKWYLRIGPDEVYFEPCNTKAGFHVSFALINQDSLRWQKKLEPVKADMEGELAKLAGAPYKARKVKFHLPDFIDIVVNAGDSRMSRGGTIGQSLPNVGPVANESRGRTVAMANLYTDKDSENVFNDAVSSLFCKDSVMPFEAALSNMSTVLHEASHNLGPSHEYKAHGKTDREAFGGGLASTLEELKAQTGAMYFADWLAGKGVIEKSIASRAHARDMAWAFGHIAQGMYTGEHKPKAYSQLAAIQVGYLLKNKAIEWATGENAANGKDQGCFHIHVEKYPANIEGLAKVVLGVKARGDKAGAEKLLAEFVDDTGEWSKLRATIRERWLRQPKPSFVYSVQR